MDMGPQDLENRIVLDGYVDNNTDCADGIPQRNQVLTNTAMVLTMTVMMILMKVLRLMLRCSADFTVFVVVNLEYVDACSAPEGYSLEITDCNDGNPLIHPDASENL